MNDVVDVYIDTNDHCVWCKYWRNPDSVTTPKSKGYCSRYPQEVPIEALYLCGEFVSKSVSFRDRLQWSHSFEIQAKKINEYDDFLV